jgi:very-short-patch-repair endonuclease
MEYTYNNPNQKSTRKTLRKNEKDAENLLWQKLRNKQVNGLKFLRQYGVGSYILDFYCSKLRLAIELDGGQHAEDQKFLYDKQRTKYLQQKNIKVIRFWNNEVMYNLNGV